jgi:hypothetical protein
MKVFTLGMKTFTLGMKKFGKIGQKKLKKVP